MPTKKKIPATKLKVELKDLRPRKDAKGGGEGTTMCIKAPALTQAYCSGPI
jgi:hypothetical protein